jgi:RHS repeat-associated protein
MHQRVAAREDVTLMFVYGDHLGSASLTANISGTKISEVCYYPFGEMRYSSGSLPSDRAFTGQRVESQSAVGNLMDYGARFYSSALGRFMSADSIVPQPGNPQSINRYAYTLNSPLNYIDPSGHDVGCAEEDVGTYCGSPIPLRAWDENGQKLSSDEQKRAIAAYVSLTEDPDLWAKLYSDPKAWDSRSLPIDLML